jgi:MATE family multidrug resistance protein
MRFSLQELRPEVRPMLALALPVVLGELAWMGMGMLDTAMVGRVSPEALGALGIGRALFMLTGVFGIGTLLGLDTLVSHAYGAGDRDDCRHSLVQGCWLSLLLAPVMAAIYLGSIPLLRRVGIDDEVIGPASSYILAVSWSALPMLLYTAFRRYLQAINLVRPVMIALISANLVNLLGNWILIWGRWGFPALGAAGAGIATATAIAYMALFLLVVIVVRERSENRGPIAIRWRFDRARVGRLFALGFPAGVQITVEVGVIALTSVLAGRFDATSVAAHQVAITLAGGAYMIPLGISSAGAVRVGQALGRGDARASGVAGWTAIGIAGAVMSASLVLFVTWPEALMRIFTTDAVVVATGVSLLLVAAVFQLFDGIAVAAIGALRGAGETRGPMVWSILGYWLVAFPVGYYLGFNRGLGVKGLWIGLCVGLIFVALIVIVLWWRRTRGLEALVSMAAGGSPR